MSIERHLAIFIYISIALWRTIETENTISGRAGEGSELHCLASEDVLLGEATVAWRRQSGNESKSLASLSVRGWERGGGAWVLVREGPLTLLIENVTRSDSGTYRCIGEDGRTETTSVHVSEQDCSGNSDWRNVSLKTLETQLDHGLPQLCLSPGQTALLSCGLNTIPPFSWELLDGDGKSRRAVDRVELPPGFGINLQDRPSLIILKLQSRDAGNYECQVNSSLSQMDLTVRPTGHFWSLIPIWIPITAATICACLYMVLLATGFAIRHRKDEADHRSRMSRLLSSFFRRSRYEGTMSVSLNRVIETPRHQSVSLRGSSGSTWYENFRSTAASPEHEATEGNGDMSADDAISYENLDHQNSDADAGSFTSEDYLEPIPGRGAHMTTEIQVHDHQNSDAEVGSFTSEDYLEPIPERGAHMTTEIQVHDHQNSDAEVGSFTSEDYLEPIPGRGAHMTTEMQVHDSQVYIPMSTPTVQKLDQKSESSDDYEKMESSGNCDMMDAEAEMTREELLRMERCRILFQRKFKSNQANRTTMADVVLALRESS